MSESPQTSRNLLERLNAGPVLCAEGYLFELERRGYLQAGAFVPEVVLEYPDAVVALHREFLRAGSDVIEAFTYYGHREKLRLIGKEELLEPLQRNALAIAKQVAAEATDATPLIAGNICNTNAWDPHDKSTDATVQAMFDEQVAWAVEAGVDFIIAETFSYYGEAQLALESIKRAGLPAVVSFALHQDTAFRDEVGIEDTAKRLEQAGAEVVGLNCARGPQTMLPYVAQIRQAVSCHVAALPVPYRTTDEQPTFQSLQDPVSGELPGDRPFPIALDPFTCNRYEMAAFARQAVDLDVRYIGGCCGTGPHHIRAMAEALGRRPPASQYSPDMSKHYALGNDPMLRQTDQEFVAKL
ncbi:MAG: homocysteine methyltransferase [Candidatus Entotheonella factor]|uniref:Homocysteine methyltransferase n=1 Tax=Entotheonella factor TaxID=1429438 RepID=W4LHH5_ENTF1|nr:homocysteine S-methyltransferase family protein [Candidatus Entotheonella palauensis]ETW97432.1 MAG: homocysteine methyltransferase [Candidatus Entotheonella factor]